MFLLQRELYFSKDPEGFQYFSGRGWGVQKLIPTETHINFDFPGGGGGRGPYPLPLDPHMKMIQTHAVCS